MGKGKKRKNPGVGVDFRKVKHKVGKKLPKAQNDTRTDFQARSINLPNQSITQDKAGAAVSERNLTIKELVSQLSHHNTSTRRDALTGLQQLTAAHPTEALRHTALLLEALAPRLSDGEPSVRTALLTALRTAVLPALGSSALAPFMPLLMAHVSAALTNLSVDVRLDALRVLEVLTEAAPQLMGQQQQLSSALGHYAGLLSRANRGKSVKSQALGGLLKVVASLDTFLQAALGAAAAAAGGSSNGSSGSNSLAAAGGAGAGEGDFGGAGRRAYGGGAEVEGGVVLMCQRAAPAPAAACQVPTAAQLLQLYCPGLTTAAAAAQQPGRSSKQQQQQQQQKAAQKLSASADDSSSSSSSSGKQQLQQQVLVLLEVLFDCWSEAAPGSLSSDPESESAQVLVHILNSTLIIMQHFSPTATAGDAAAAAGTITSPAAGGGGGGGVSQQCCCPGFNTRREQVQWVQQAAAVVLPQLVKVFPVAPPATRSLSTALCDLLQRFNSLAMQLMSGFMAAGVCWPQQQQQQQQSNAQRQQQQQLQQLAWQQQLLEFMAGVLATGSCLPHLQRAAAAAGGRSSTGTPGSKGQQQQQQQSTPTATAQPANSSSSSSLSSSTMLVTVLTSLQQLLPSLTGPPRQHILAAVGQLAAAAAAAPQPQPQAAGTSAAAAAANQPDHNSNSSGAAVGLLMPLSAAAAGAAGSNAVRVACLRLQLDLLVQQLTAQRGAAAADGSISGSIDSSGDGGAAADIAAWLAAAPRVLFQLGSSKPKISQLLLQLLFEAARLSVPGSLTEQQLQGLQPQLAALLATALPPPKPQQQQQQQGTKNKAGGTPAAAAAAAAAGGAGAGGQDSPVPVLVGPLADLPFSCQALAFDALAHLTLVTPPLLKAVALCCRITSYSDAAVQRLLDGLLSSAAAAGSMPPDVFVSFVCTLLSPGPVGGYADRGAKGRRVQAGFARHQLLVDAVCRSLHSYGPLTELLQLVTPPLLQQWQQQQQLLGVVVVAVEQQQQQQLVVMQCLSYSLVAVAALSAGCWRPSTSTSSSSGSSVVTAANAVSSQSGSVSAPVELLSVLPAVLAAHCFSRTSSSSSPSATDGFAAEAALQQCMQQLVLPLCLALPSTELLLPFVQQLVVVQGVSERPPTPTPSSQQQQQQQQQKAAAVRVVCQVLRGLLGQQGLRAVWLQHGPEVQLVLQQVEAVAQRVQTQSGDGTGLAEVQQLQTTLGVICDSS